MPAHLKGEAHLVLQYGHDLPIPIPDLQIDEHGVSATLSFMRTPWATVVPWSAVYVVTSLDGRGVLYKEDVPGDVSVIAASADAPADDTKPSGVTAADQAAAPPPASPRRTLRAVPATGPLDDAPVDLDVLDETPADDLVSSRRRKRPQLRLVK